MLGFALLSVLQQPLPPPPTPDSFTQLLLAWQGKQWVIFGAIFVGIVIAASKTGWFGTWLANELPPQARPFLAVVVSVLTVASTEIGAGVDWKLALLHAFYAAATAVTSHQLFIEGFRKGKEIMPNAPWHNPDPPDDSSGPNSASPPPTPRTPPPSGPTIKFLASSPAVVTRRAVSFALLALAGCGAWWQQFQQDPAAAVSQLVQYVTGFIGTAQAFWQAFILPLLGSKAQDANTAFENAIVTLHDTLATLEDAVRTAALAHQDNPDFSQIIAAVQDAVAKVVDIIQHWETSTPSEARAGASYVSSRDTLNRQAKHIAEWRKK